MREEIKTREMQIRKYQTKIQVLLLLKKILVCLKQKLFNFFFYNPLNL